MGDESVWVTVGTLPPGSLFETRDGDRRLKSWGAYPAACISLTTGDVTWLLPHTPARPLTPVAVAPSLPADLRGLLLGALATGATDPLCDFLLERLADPDVARSIRANVRREIETIHNSWGTTPADISVDAVREHRVEGRRCVLCGMSEDTLARNSAAGIYLPCSVG
jgi:hypothetical protein